MEEHDVVGPLPENIRFLDALSHDGPNPSQGSKSTDYARAQSKRNEVIYDGRWTTPDVSTVAPPIQIFHPIFETFVHDASGSHIQPSREDIIHTQKLMHLASKITNETSRAKDLREILSIILQVAILQEQNSDASTPDGMYTAMFNGISIAFLIWELKREVGEGGSDASTQAELSMRQVWTQKNRAEFVKKCCCPTLILAGGGPWLTVLVAYSRTSSSFRD
ncbi:hypothetical protein BDQ12DRAFT_692377 [Crucibulum laeve]|uniref:Uncharacterized protein n=1 Tax=Crucibulum laeve TaxID=68775 RepID=A0A5C3LIN3_9AGAR|nr:hypothetical protein BDQ12DRAFT_692377 [Crucibulum laeve]